MTRYRLFLPPAYPRGSKVSWRARRVRGGAADDLVFDAVSVPDRVVPAFIIASLGTCMALASMAVAVWKSPSASLAFCAAGAGFIAVLALVAGVAYASAMAELRSVRDRLASGGLLVRREGAGEVQVVQPDGSMRTLASPVVLEGCVSFEPVPFVSLSFLCSAIMDLQDEVGVPVVCLNMAAWGSPDRGTRVVRRWAAEGGIPCRVVQFELSPSAG